MENAAKALEIAAGVILAVILMSLIAYFFSSIGEWPQQQDDMESAEQLANFNLEYEVYDKSTMYGVDVISCLNKARSNNEKYIEGQGFLTGSRYDSSYLIDVYVSINEALSEDLQVYYFDETTNTERLRVDENTDPNYNNVSNKTLGAIGFKNMADKASNNGTDKGYYTTFTYETVGLYNHSEELDDDPTIFMLPDTGNHIYNGRHYYSLRDDIQVITLLNLAKDNPKVTMKNTNTNTLRDWSTATWTTALYDFKTKRFTCDNIEYSSSTGRVNKIYFSEV